MRRTDLCHPAQGAGQDKPVAAAEYVRMSTEHQRYSTQNQAEAIREYAAKRGYEIVRTYADEGRSGVTLERRWGLRALISDVTSGSAGYSVVLVYDVSRWGRFQDIDESAYYEYQCKRNGVNVEYCAEEFDNDGSFSSDVLKLIKRKMAGEYSRELSRKVFAGQCRLIELGFRQGGPVGLGLRRLLIDEAGRPKTVLATREHKCIFTDRIVLVPGPPEEVETIRRIYHRYVDGGRSPREISDELNAQGIITDLGRRWHPHTVREILSNEKYIGNNVWNRTSYKLGQKHVKNDKSVWIRADGVFEPIIDIKLFKAAQAVIRERSRRHPDEEMLDALRRLLKIHGFLSYDLINSTSGCPTAQTYTRRFGSVLHCYSMVGYKPEAKWEELVSKSGIQKRNLWVAAETMDMLRKLGLSIVFSNRTRLFGINGKLTAALALGLPAKCSPEAHIIHINPKRVADVIIVACLSSDQSTVSDYYLLPYAIDHRSRIILHADKRFWLDKCRLESAEQIMSFA